MFAHSLLKLQKENNANCFDILEPIVQDSLSLGAVSIWLRSFQSDLVNFSGIK